MEILGYSERGVLNSLLYEIKYSANSLELFDALLSSISFPYVRTDFQIRDAKILIDQSFSDFGDADSVLLVDNKGSKQSVFIEAKVKTFNKSWSIKNEFERFENLVKRNILGSSGKKSNLFTQIYYKVRLIKEMQKGGMTSLQRGTSFPRCFLTEEKSVRKIGENEVVLNAVELLSQYKDNVFFIIMVPEEDSVLESFYRDDLKKFDGSDLPEWTVENWGHMSWTKTEDFCKRFGLKETQKAFAFNDGQIY